MPSSAAAASELSAATRMEVRRILRWWNWVGLRGEVEVEGLRTDWALDLGWISVGLCFEVYHVHLGE
jgi:hypothetical protein